MAADEPIICVKCGHVAEEKEEYCTKCGSPLINRCSDRKGLIDKGCSKVNKPDAAFCAKCGLPTVFNKQGLVFPSR
jgi:RNA polymerase subunit RPABC4/transcription elongation factor Spt4